MILGWKTGLEPARFLIHSQVSLPIPLQSPCVPNPWTALNAHCLFTVFYTVWGGLSGWWGSNPRTTPPLCRHQFPRLVASTTRSHPVLVGIARLELTTSCSQSTHTTNCTISRISKNKKPHSFQNGVVFNLKTSHRKIKRSFPIQHRLDVVAVGALCSLNFS